MIGKDPAQVMNAASAEIACARRIPRGETKDRDFRKGSRGRAYCDDLQQFISLFFNVSVPQNVTPDFIDAVKPLALDLLQRWTIPSLRQLVDHHVHTGSNGE